MKFFTFSFSAQWLCTSQEIKSCYFHVIASSKHNRDLLHNWWSLIAAGGQAKRGEINVSGQHCWNMSGLDSDKQVHTAFHTKVLLGEFLCITSPTTCDIDLCCTGLKNKNGLCPCRQKGFSSTVHLVLSLKFFKSSDKLLIMAWGGKNPTKPNKKTW